ncbi:MAG TPA: class III poly(R)-hydroxyalkanoic acid synthase subunit PhaC [Phycisphaerales bacterium]|nr:class III poly(R)-hydroxyalkanoic acid synthase subunit PhaC [Phycisphaerales bacterium]
MTYSTPTPTPPPMPFPLPPMPDFSAMLGAWQGEMDAFQRKLAAMPKIAEILSRTKKGCTPHDVVMSEPPVRLLRYQSDAPKKHATPVLFVFALVNKPYVLDLLPHKSVVRRFLEAGYDVWMIDWGTPSPGDAQKTLHDYVEGHMHQMVQRVLEETGQDSLNLVGYCMGGTMSAMYTSLHQDLVRNLVLMAAPLDWSTEDSLLMTWTRPENFDVDAVVDAFGLIPPQFLGTSFMLLKPVANLFQKWTGFYEKMDDEKFLEEFFAMEVWSNDNIPIAGEVYRDFVKYGFQQNLLLKGKFPLGRKKIDLGEITCPVMNITADSDHLVHPCQSTPLKEVVGSDDYSEMSVKAGHIGLSVGSRAHKELWPKVCQWMAERSDPIGK